MRQNKTGKMGDGPTSQYKQSTIFIRILSLEMDLITVGVRPINQTTIEVKTT